MPVDGGESGRSVRDLQRGTDTLVAVHCGPQPGVRGPGGGRGGEAHQRGRVENALTASERANERASLARDARALAVSRDNWDTVYYRLRAIYAVRGV